MFLGDAPWLLRLFILLLYCSELPFNSPSPSTLYSKALENIPPAVRRALELMLCDPEVTFSTFLLLLVEMNYIATLFALGESELLASYFYYRGECSSGT